ncbi:Serine threonine- kinase ssp1 [Pyrenophora seminiperda CCB06]|uniref:non-specific serine/threonine protein kinase n=1 Tax=Pyrenophora seminiperda CCB06 TaxID=1302712 RepID=A0A3M7LUV1_9PLEO|nr:Serine threonine- kinase ssp1 [Pyrenophora seminiperda CCB06]
MVEPNAVLTTEGDSRHAATPWEPASSMCDPSQDTARDETAAHPQEQEQRHEHEHEHEHEQDGQQTPGQPQHGGHDPLDENDCTPRSELPAVPDALNASLLSHIHTLDPEPSYFSPQPLRIYSSPIPHDTPPASSNPSPSSSAHASHSELTKLHDDVQRAHAPLASLASLASLVPLSDRPAFMRDLSTASTASNVTVRANSVDPQYQYPLPTRQRDGPVYPNQSYAALHLQQYPQPHVPPIVRSRSSHPSHSAANSLSSLGAFGLSHDHYKDIMESAPRTVGNSPVSSPGLFNPSKRHSSHNPDQQTDDGTYSTPWLHHTHRQPPKETHVADVQADPVSGRKIVNQYEIIDELGRGVHGKVKLGKDLVHGRYVAIKIVDRYSKRRRLGKNNSHEDKIKREIAILKKARHPNIVSLLEVIDDPAKKKVYIVLEHVELGEVKWRTEGAREICLVEWRRFKRESQGIFDNDSAILEDEKIIRVAHQKLARQQRRMAKEAYLRRRKEGGESNPAWSLEFGMDSEDEYSETSRASQASSRDDDRTPSRVHFRERQDEDHMETAFRSPEPANNSYVDALEGTMYGAYDNDFNRGRVPSIAGSSSSRLTDPEEEIPEHFNYVPLMTTHAAWEAFKDTVLGIEYLHYQNVIHRDIKPANLLVTREHRIKISDFGVSYLGRQKTDESNGEQSESDYQEVDEAIELAKTVGTPAFYAPELCRTEIDSETPLIDGGIDIWALGVTLYCLIYGRVPFHDTNTYTLMKVISEDEPYIPRFRLKPVAEHSNSRPNSHSRNNQSMISSKRAPHDLEYEEVDENLRDLLRRLLIKDARYRITIPEIKRHPWLLSGIPNHISWAEETDPSKSYDGRKIQISKEDVDEAVVPIGFVDRLRSAAKKTSEFVKGFTTRSSGSRRRAQSSAANQDAPPSITANSSSSTISQDARPYEGRRSSLAPGAILEILTRSRESDHPLSHSVTASPEAKELSRYFDSPNSRTASPAQHDFQRPSMQDRAVSSISTIRQADLLPGRSASPSFPPALPGTPTALDTPGGSQLGGLFGGLPRRVVNSMRSKDKLKPPKEHSRARSIDRLVGGDDDAHGVPSLAISTTCASGQVNQPDALKDLSPVARTSSPCNSEAQSCGGRLDSSSRQSSLSSLSSRLHRTWAAANELEIGPTLGFTDPRLVPQRLRPTDRRPSSPSVIARERSEDRFDRAKDEYRRRLGVEQSAARDRSYSGTHRRSPSGLAQSICPPSPDDEIAFCQQRRQEYWHRNDQSSDNSPVGGSSRGLALSSSEDQFSAMSQSESNPSIPSVASAGSPPQGGCEAFDDQSWNSTTGESFPAHQQEPPVDDSAGYDGDHAIESDEDDDSDEDGLIMGFAKKKVPTHTSHRSNSVSNAELARQNIHAALNTRRRSNRSGSNGTVKKIPPPEPGLVCDRTAESE